MFCIFLISDTSYGYGFKTPCAVAYFKWNVYFRHKCYFYFPSLGFKDDFLLNDFLRHLRLVNVTFLMPYTSSVMVF